MLMPVVAFLIGCMLLGYRGKGPIWVISISWLFCILPIAFGWLDYGLFKEVAWFPAALIGLLACYIGGCVLRSLTVTSSANASDMADTDRRFVVSFSVVQQTWWIGLAGVGFVIADFAFNGGAGLDDLVAIRDAVTGRQSASLLAQVGSIMTWACLYCYLFAIVYRRRLSKFNLVRFIIPVAGYFLLSVLSAGRQAAFQVMMVTILGVAVSWDRKPSVVIRRSRHRDAIPAIVMSAVMTGYMGYVAIARNDNVVSDDKGEVIKTLFTVDLSPAVDRTISSLGANVHSAIIEGLVYFSSAVPLFQRYLETEMGGLSYGAMSFPFIFRQLQGLTGLAPGALLDDKVARLNAAGVIGAGWTTSFSAYLKDFGTIGGAAFLVILGFYTMDAWKRARRTADFDDIVIAVVLMLVAIYSPLIPAQSDTNILFLWLFALAARWLRRNGAVSLAA